MQEDVGGRVVRIRFHQIGRRALERHKAAIRRDGSVERALIAAVVAREIDRNQLSFAGAAVAHINVNLVVVVERVQVIRPSVENDKIAADGPVHGADRWVRRIGSLITRPVDQVDLLKTARIEISEENVTQRLIRVRRDKIVRDGGKDQLRPVLSDLRSKRIQIAGCGSVRRDRDQ